MSPSLDSPPREPGDGPSAGPGPAPWGCHRAGASRSGPAGCPLERQLPGSSPVPPRPHPGRLCSWKLRKLSPGASTPGAGGLPLALTTPGRRGQGLGAAGPQVLGFCSAAHFAVWPGPSYVRAHKPRFPRVETLKVPEAVAVGLLATRRVTRVAHGLAPWSTAHRWLSRPSGARRRGDGLKWRSWLPAGDAFLSAPTSEPGY